jgi:hypothetical protein
MENVDVVNTPCPERLILLECHKADGEHGIRVKIANVPMLSLFRHPTHGHS